MKNIHKVLASFCLVAFAMFSAPVQAQHTEERFQDLFITAGYATAFGAALGAAILSFQPQPERHLRYVAMGASLGFISGSVIGSYIIFSPALAASDEAPRNTLLIDHSEIKGIVVRPVINTRKGTLIGLESAMTLVEF